MIYSMTAFARTSLQEEWGHVIWEIRTVNHRYLDIHIRLPDCFREWEPSVREAISTLLSRGKIDCQLYFSPGTGLPQTFTINDVLADQLLAACNNIAKRMSTVAALSPTDILRWPDVLQAERINITPFKEPILASLHQALDDVKTMRAREGDALAKAIEKRLDTMQSTLDSLIEQLPIFLNTMRDKLVKCFSELSVDCEPHRLEQEMVLAIQKADVHEEIDRLNTHIAEIRQLLKKGGTLGRKLDFFMQELNREANTLASKSTDKAITRAAVDMKVWIEQMREQIQNIA